MENLLREKFLFIWDKVSRTQKKEEIKIKSDYELGEELEQILLIVDPKCWGLGYYSSKGIVYVHPLAVLKRENYYVIAHELGHGIFGYGHHAPPRNCLMDGIDTEGKKHGKLCESCEAKLKAL